MHEEIFVQKIYAFKTDNPAPRIIDGGANIGLATIFLKNCYPMARITAFEADPTIAAILRSNLMSQGISDVEIQEAALWSESGKILFNSEGADGGKIGHQNPDSLYVKTLPLLNFLHEPIDFLKLDIEGAEFEVLSSCGDKLAAVRKAFIEYHSQIGGPQYLPELLYLLKKSGFRCFISTPSVFNPRPLEASKSYNGFDMVLNLFCVRPEF
jgi:FkbM family methyltransferase